MKRILAFLMVFLMLSGLFTLTTAAAASPTPVEYYTMIVGTKGEGSATVDKDFATSDDVVTFTATLVDNSYFVGWEITGDFEPVSGDELSTTVSIKPKSNITMIAVFRGGEDAEAVLQVPMRGSQTSPQTGQSAGSVYAALALLCVAAFGVCFSTYKLKKN